jgi:TctA family transporter
VSHFRRGRHQQFGIQPGPLLFVDEAQLLWTLIASLFIGLVLLPAITGVIPGPDAELQLRRALQIADGEWTTPVSTPLSITVYLLVVALLVVPFVRRRMTRGNSDDTDDSGGPEKQQVSGRA